MEVRKTWFNLCRMFRTFQKTAVHTLIYLSETRVLLFVRCTRNAAHRRVKGGRKHPRPKSVLVPRPEPDEVEGALLESSDQLHASSPDISIAKATIVHTDIMENS